MLRGVCLVNRCLWLGGENYEEFKAEILTAQTEAGVNHPVGEAFFLSFAAMTPPQAPHLII
jgi:hypothetical protein